VNLPRLMVLTDRARTTMPLVEVVDRAVQGGARAVVLRERDLDVDERAQLADQLRALLAPVDGLLVFAGPGADAVHLNATEPVPSPRPHLIGRSCHDEGEVRAAAGCDWITLSPWGVSESKPGYGPPLGPSRFASLVADAPPAFALGGVGPVEVAACRAAGAYGVAVMGAVMRAERPERVVAELLAELAA
jgi:thiamine-phosphate pyrophosphorylase